MKNRTINRRKCVVCKKNTPDDELNGFQECTKASCYGTFMDNLRKGDKPMFPASKPKKTFYGKKNKSKMGKQWRSYSKVKKENIATPLGTTPTLEEEQALTDKV